MTRRQLARQDSRTRSPPPCLRPRCGSVDYSSAKANVSKGPSDLRELSMWPEQILSDVMSHPGGCLRRRRLEDFLSNGIIMHSDFTGKGSVEATFKILGKVAKACIDETRAWSPCCFVSDHVEDVTRFHMFSVCLCLLSVLSP